MSAHYRVSWLALRTGGGPRLRAPHTAAASAACALLRCRPSCRVQQTVQQSCVNVQVRLMAQVCTERGWGGHVWAGLEAGTLWSMCRASPAPMRQGLH